MRVNLKEKIGKFVWDYLGFPKAGLIAQESSNELRELPEDLTKTENEPMTKKGPVSPEEIVELYNARVDEIKQLKKENKELKQIMKQKVEGFEFKIIENYVEFNKDELCIKDNNTRIELKNGNLFITVFIPDLNEVKRFHYRVTGKTLMREYIMLKEEWNND